MAIYITKKKTRLKTQLIRENQVLFPEADPETDVA